MNPFLPTPFTTMTLRKLSGISRNPFELLDDSGKKELLNDIEHILAADFPNDEIRKDTRVSWAASIILRLVPLLDIDLKQLYNKRVDMEIALQKKHTHSPKGPINEQDIYNKYKRNELRKLNGIYGHIFSLVLKALYDNIAKPKLWKKCVVFCCITGYDGLSKLLDMLKDKRLTDAGQRYLYNTILDALIKNVLLSIKIYKSNHFTEREKDNTATFVKTVSVWRDTYQSSKSQIPSDEQTAVLFTQLKWSLQIYNKECHGENIEIRVNKDFICFLWRSLPLFADISSNEATPAVIRYVMSNMPLDNKNIIIKKILLMFPGLRSEINYPISFAKELSPNSVKPYQEDGITYISLQQLFVDGMNNSKPRNIYNSEWAALKIIQKILDNTFKKETLKLEFDNLHIKSRFKNCAPCNFYVNSNITQCKTWDKLKDFFKEYNIEYIATCADSRFDSEFYNTDGNIIDDRRIIYSCSVLLLTLLSGSMNFSPMISRGGKLEQNYKYLLLKINDVSVSSYTQAILNLCDLDKWSGGGSVSERFRHHE